jgi:integrase
MPGAHRPREFMEEELLDANPARGFIVKPGDPRLQPLRPARRRRAVPPAEIHKFMRVVRPRSVAACWAPLLTGARPGELFATRRDDIDPDLELIYLHQTADRFGRISPGTKTTHHLAEKAERGRWTLFPRPLIDLCDEGPAALSGLLFRAREARFGPTATSTATCGNRRGESPARTSRCTTCGIHSLPGSWRPAFRSPRLRPGWAIRSVPAALQSTRELSPVCDTGPLPEHGSLRRVKVRPLVAAAQARLAAPGRTRRRKGLTAPTPAPMAAPEAAIGA